MRAFILSVVFLAIAFAQNGNDETRRDQAISNIDRLAIRITLDRGSFLPGEEIGGSIRVENPTGTPLEVPAPFAKGNGAVFLQERGNATARSLGEEFGDVEPDRLQPELSKELITLAPGRSVELKIRPSSGEDDDEDRRLQFVSPIIAGEYRLGFEYGDVFAAFRIEQAPIESWTFATRARPALVKENRFEVAEPRRVFALVFRSGSQRVLCVSLIDKIGGEPDLYVDANGISAGLQPIKPIRRVAVAAGPVTDLRLQILGNERLRLTWKEGGQVKLVDLNDDREKER
jgi:hypothetical protein